MKFNAIIVRYGEISLKGRNRIRFERHLQADIERFLDLRGHRFSSVALRRGRLYVRGIEGEKIPGLENVFGIYSYSPALEIPRSMEALKKETARLLPLFAGVKSFRISCQRVDKSFPFDSMEIEREIGEIVRREADVPVNLDTPHFTLWVEIGQGAIYIFFEKIRGFGGLPYGGAGKLVSLISGGIDSPVATFLMMKRGVEVVLLHFRITERGYQKVLKLKEKLEEYSAGREIKLAVFDRADLFRGKFSTLYEDRRYQPYICILCKHLMHRKAAEVAAEVGALGLITGDNISQVASQTLKNLYAYRTVSGLPVYSPLIGFDKEDTVNIAKKIGTFAISIAEADGCIPPKRPKTGVKTEIFERILRETGLNT